MTFMRLIPPEAQATRPTHFHEALQKMDCPLCKGKGILPSSPSWCDGERTWVYAEATGLSICFVCGGDGKVMATPVYEVMCHG
jgi:hypothetical protein